MEATVKRRQTFGMLPPNDDSQLGKEYETAVARFRETMSDLDQILYRQQFTGMKFNPVHSALFFFGKEERGFTQGFTRQSSRINHRPADI